MCLGNRLSKKKLQEYKDSGKKQGYIRVWKRVEEKRTCYQSLVQGRRYKGGLCLSRNDAWRSDALIHAFRRKSARQFGDDAFYKLAIIECLVKPEWIVTISSYALTTKAIVMPEYPKTKVTIREFRAAIKGKRVKKYSWE